MALRLDVHLTAHAAGVAKARPYAFEAPPPAVTTLAALHGQSHTTDRPETQSEETVDPLLFEAVTLHRHGRLDAAALLYRRLLAQPLAPIKAHLGLARLIAKRSGPEAAARHLEDAYAHTPHAALAVEAGRWLAEAADTRRARLWLEQARPHLQAEDVALLARMYLLDGRHDDAVGAYRQALQSGPGQAGWWLGLGAALLAVGDEDQARAAFQMAWQNGRWTAEVEAYLRGQIAQR